MGCSKFKITGAGFYKDRAGGKAEVVGKGAQGYWVGTDADGDLARWDDEGNWGRFSAPRGGYDIVAEWKEPKKIKGYVNLYSGYNENLPGHKGKADLPWQFGGLKSSREQADYAASAWQGTYQRVACLEIDIEESHGLGGSR
jgi:hypothetical protein